MLCCGRDGPSNVVLWERRPLKCCVVGETAPQMLCCGRDGPSNVVLWERRPLKCCVVGETAPQMLCCGRDGPSNVDIFGQLSHILYASMDVISPAFDSFCAAAVGVRVWSKLWSLANYCNRLCQPVNTHTSVTAGTIFIRLVLLESMQVYMLLLFNSCIVTGRKFQMLFYDVCLLFRDATMLSVIVVSSSSSGSLLLHA